MSVREWWDALVKPVSRPEPIRVTYCRRCGTVVASKLKRVLRNCPASIQPCDFG